MRPWVAPLFLLAVLLTAAEGGAALAHANYVRSDPAPNARLSTAPSEVLVGFSEKIVAAQSHLVLLSADGATLADASRPTADPTELALPLGSLGRGTFVVAWRTLSAEDGDAAKGYFAFAVGEDKPASGSLSRSAEQEGLTVGLTVTPGRAGANTHRVTVSDRSGRVPSNISRVRLRFEFLDRDLGATEHVLAPDGEAFAATGLELALRGRFRVTAEVRRRDVLEDLRVPFELAVPAAAPAAPTPSAAQAPAETPAPSEPGGPPGLLIGLAVAVIAAAVALVAARRRAR